MYLVLVNRVKLGHLGNWIDTTLGGSLVSKPFAAIGQIRSSGITDLRYGHLLESSWHGKDQFERTPDSQVPLPAGVNCIAVAATTSDQPGAVKDALIADGRVPLKSALDQHVEASHGLALAISQWTAYGKSHRDLLSRPEVGAEVPKWLAT